MRTRILRVVLVAAHRVGPYSGSHHVTFAQSVIQYFIQALDVRLAVQQSRNGMNYSPRAKCA